MYFTSGRGGRERDREREREREREGKRKRWRGLRTYAAHNNPLQQQCSPSRHTLAASRTLHRSHKVRQIQSHHIKSKKPKTSLLRNPLSSSIYGCTCHVDDVHHFIRILPKKYSKDFGGLTIRVGAALLAARPLCFRRRTPLFRPIREGLHPCFCRPCLEGKFDLGCFRFCRPAFRVCCLGFGVWGLGLCISAASASVVLHSGFAV
jgi:hypothetical protein